MGNSGQNDELVLRELNLKIGEAENSGDRKFLASVLAPRLAFQRADEARTVDNEVAFLQKVTDGGTRVTRVIEPIALYGDRAIVQCMVTIGEKQFHNLRLFVKRDGDWKLLGWANAAV
jgi:Domain of unknown function (DUF4440)